MASALNVADCTSRLAMLMCRARMRITVVSPSRANVTVFLASTPPRFSKTSVYPTISPGTTSV